MGDLSDRMSGQDGITSLGAYMQAMRPSAKAPEPGTDEWFDAIGEAIEQHPIVSDLHMRLQHPSAEPPAKILPWRECDWPEDSANGEENGDYFNRCTDCGTQFRGHKRRNRCKSCVTFVHPEEADEPQPAEPPQPAVGEQTPQQTARECGKCGEPILDTRELRHFGLFIAHPEDRCIQLLRSRIALAEDRADRAEAERDAAKRAHTEMCARADRLQGQCAGFQAQVRMYMADNDALRQRVERAEHDAKEELNAAQARIAELEERLALSEDNARQSLMEIEAMRGDEHRLQEALEAERRCTGSGLSN